MKRALAAIAVLGLAGTAAIAQDAPDAEDAAPRIRTPWRLLAHDANADGSLSRAELDAALAERFGGIDGNGDGELTPGEMLDARIGGEFGGRGMGPDGRGRRHGHGWGHHGPRGGGDCAMGRGDGPRDGSGRGPGAGPRDGSGPGAGPRDGSGPRAGGGRRGGGFGDADGDGRLTLEEFSARAVLSFTTVDANEDGVVTIAELQAYDTAAPADE